jgi:hypothetical protein
VPLTVALFPVLVATSTLSGFTTQVELLTGGYVRVRLDGIYLVERKFQSGDREVRLTGMMHVADREFYSSLLTGIDPAIPSVVLVEGVTDRRRLLGGKTLSYNRVARFLNLTPQSDSIFSQQIAEGLDGRDGQNRRRASPERRRIVRLISACGCDVVSFQHRQLSCGRRIFQV